MFNNLRNIALAVSLALAVGYFAGYYTKGQFVKADQLDAVTEAHQQTAVDIQEGLKTSTAVEQQVTASNQQIETIRKVVAKRIEKEQSDDGAHLSLGHPACGPLDLGTVRLLNAAREGTAADATGFGDGEGQAPSDVGIAEFIDNDIQVVELYHELATRHNALVDYVESLVEKQAK